MGQEILEKENVLSYDDPVSLHTLCEEDFPWLLLWMTKETNASLSLLLQTTKGSTEIIIITATINHHERVSLLTVYAAAFTKLKTGYDLQPGEYSIQQWQLNPLILKNKQVLFTLLDHYTNYLFKSRVATKIVWEIHHLDELYHELAQKAGFRKSGLQSHKNYILYEYVG
jgi:hypothetical protein